MQLHTRYIQIICEIQKIKGAVPLDTHMQVMQTMSTRIGGKDQTPNRALEGNVKTGSTRMTRMDPRLASPCSPHANSASQQISQPKPDTVDTHASACMSTRMACKPCRPCRHASTLAAPLVGPDMTEVRVLIRFRMFQIQNLLFEVVS